MPEINYDNIVRMIDDMKALIAKFIDMLKEFVGSWKKVPSGSKSTATEA